MKRADAIKKYKSLRRWGGSPPSVEEVVSHMNVSPDEAQAIITEMEDILSEEKAPVMAWLLPFLRWPMLFFAATAVFLSCYYAIHWLSAQQAPYVAWIMSITLIGFGLFSFEISAYLRTQKRKNWWLFLIIWALIVTYNVSTILASLYSTYTTKQLTEETDLSSTLAVRRIYESTLSTIKEKQDTLMSLQAKLKTQQGVLAEYDTRAKQLADSKGYGNASWLVIVTEKEIKALEATLQEKRKEADALLRENPNIMREEAIEKKPEFFSWIGARFRINPATIQFILYAIPALVLDIIAAAALYIFLYLGRDTKKEEKV